MFGGRVFTESRQTYGYQLCISSHRLVPLFVRCILHTGASPEKRKEASYIYIYIYKTRSFDVLSLTNSRFGDLLIAPIPLGLK
jgi:hypothetical protein